MYVDGITVASSQTVRNLGVISEQSVSIKLNVMLLFTCTISLQTSCLLMLKDYFM